ncbi:hypothetical protein [Roseospira navarrensis]|uniref:Uncharacterized protein n=1 Tax=Roseospira navarrensis TaxID=140058 RepID=A0A7X2D2D2_9PROT|nr:hypothetical protein [Roseospira navarrensis]MQX36174.1 hypothetical protein [Roseospira navarrensis]
MTQPDYNEIFERLTQLDVSGQADVGVKHALGLIAYGIYKQDKREFIHLWQQETGCSPPPEEVQRWVKDRTRDSQLRKLRREATSVLLEVQKEAVAKAAPHIRAETLRRTWWPNVLSSVTGTALYTMGLICLAFILALAGIDAVAVFQAVVDAVR